MTVDVVGTARAELAAGLLQSDTAPLAAAESPTKVPLPPPVPAPLAPVPKKAAPEPQSRG